MDEVRIPRHPEDDYSPEQVECRRSWLERQTGQKLDNLRTRPSFEAMRGACENVIGSIGVPVGVAGPLLIRGQHVNGPVLVPLATTEGALVASYSRGMKLITESGGCTVFSPGNSIGGLRTLGAVICKVSAVLLTDQARTADFDAWLRTETPAIASIAEATSRHCRFVELVPLYQGDIVGLMFKYETGQAMGLNIATKANEAACRYIAEKSGLVCGYFNTLGGDKRFVNTEGKGRTVTANVTIPRPLLEKTLRTTPELMARYLSACNLILAPQGATATNIHIANALTALFIALGQDPAFVTVSFKNACTSFTVTSEGDLAAAVTLPNLILGTVGGGTKLPAQRECLGLLGCVGNVERLAEIVAAVALAGEISVAGAVSAGEFARAHITLGRGAA